MKKWLIAAVAAAAMAGAGTAASADPVSVTYYQSWSESASGLTFSNPFFSETIPDINFNYAAAGCDTSVASRPNASCSWAGKFSGSLGVAADGSYNLTLGSDDASYLFIDGLLVHSLPGSHGFFTNTVPLTLTAGSHSFELQYYNTFCCGAAVQLTLDRGVVFEPPSTGGGIPEPATWAMMIMGFGGVGSMVRNRRRSLAVA